MKLHVDKKNFADLLSIISSTSKIDADILEKDYYVCVVLEQLAHSQSELKAYFKGGTALYKKLNEMRRFSEDIDLTVRNDEVLSKTRNKKKFEESAKGYETEGLKLLTDKTDNRKGSITAFYEYQTIVEYIVNPLRRSGEIQVEATSFTESEPLEDCEIIPLIYKFANGQQQGVLCKNYAVEPFILKIVKLEHTFIDKLFAAQKYFVDMETPELSRPTELAKHLYDIAVLFKEKRVKDFLEDTAEVKRIETIRRKEEQRRIGGVPDNVQMHEFSFLSNILSSDVIRLFYEMQDKYVLSDQYKVSSDELADALNQISKKLLALTHSVS